MPTAPAPAKPAAVRLNDSQVTILQALAKVPAGNPGLTTDQLKKLGATVNAGNVGPAFKSVLDNYPDSLYGLGLARPVKLPDEELTWEATAKGRALAAKVKGRRKAKEDGKVPPAVLDPVVRRFLPTRTYGLEVYTDDDIKAIRADLGADFAEISLTGLRGQIVNRRKQGAFANPADAARRAALRAIRDFGEDGAVFPNLLTTAQVKQLRGIAGPDDE